LSPAHLRAFDYQRAALGELGLSFEQQLFFFVEFQVQNIAFLLLAARIHVQPEKLTRSKPVLLAGSEDFLRMPDHLELIVTEKSLQQSLDANQFRRNWLRLRDVLRHHKPAPDCLCRLQGRRHAHQNSYSDYKR
jgi:hypothetical protein